jgi:hypothetical protein
VGGGTRDDQGNGGEVYGQSVSDAWEVEKNIDGTRFIIRVSRALQMNDGQRSTTGSTDVTPPASRQRTYLGLYLRGFRVIGDVRGGHHFVGTARTRRTAL